MNLHPVGFEPTTSWDFANECFYHLSIKIQVMNVLNDQPEQKPVSSARALVGPSEDAAKNCIISTFAAKLQQIQTNVEA